MKPYYEQDGISIYHGDCREVLPALDVQVDAVVSDPPYGTEALGGGYGRHGQGGARTIENDGDLSALSGSLPPTLRALKPDAWMAYFCAAKRRHEVNLLLLGYGIGLFGEVVWDKGAPGLGYHIRYAHETVVVCQRGEPERPASPLLSVIRAAAESAFHPHQKPDVLMRKLVEWVCPVGGLLLDPFMGSGSTLRAAKDCGRRAIGCEVNERYCEVAATRLAQGVLFAPLPALSPALPANPEGGRPC